MKERPIIFNSEMVRAILDGRKTQTRRIITARPPKVIDLATVQCKYGQPGDRLWVKETWRGGNDTLENVFYKASDNCALKYGFCQCSWKPSIFMPHEFSRITLEIVNVRVERLQDISEKDVIAEGIEEAGICFGIRKEEVEKHCYKLLWDKINGPGAWEKNPWVWVIEFKKV